MRVTTDQAAGVNLRIFLVTVALLAFTTIVPALAADDVDGWKLTQSARTDGNVDVYITRSALRIFIPKNKLCVLANAPWQEIAIYCTKTGNIFKSPLAKFRNPYLSAIALFDGGSLVDIVPVLKGPIKNNGLDSRLYIEPKGFSQKQLAKRASGIITGRAPMSIEYIVTDSFKTAPQVGQILTKFFALPLSSSVPLSFIFTSVVKSKESEIVTTSCKHIKIKTADFKVPTGLKAVKEGISVLVPDSADGGLDLMMMGRSKLK